METGFLHLHTTSAILYILFLSIISFFILTNKKGAFDTLRAKLKFPRIIIEAILTITGLFLLVKAPNGLSSDNIIKYIAVVGAVFLSIMAFKKFKSTFALAALALMVYSFMVSKTHSSALIPDDKRVDAISEKYQINQNTLDKEQQLKHGLEIYQEVCQRCHGIDGQAKYRKSKNLAESQISDGQKDIIIQNGQNMMPPFPYLSEKERQNLILYINTFKK